MFRLAGCRILDGSDSDCTGGRIPLKLTFKTPRSLAIRWTICTIPSKSRVACECALGSDSNSFTLVEWFWVESTIDRYRSSETCTLRGLAENGSRLCSS